MKTCGDNCNCTIFHEDVLNEVEEQILSNQKINEISDFFKIMADFTRVKILEAIKDHELCVCDLGHLLGVTKSAVSHQMKTLKKYNLVTSTKKGKMVYYKLNDENVSTIINSVNKFIQGEKNA
ncbi:ArsR/SmtB family transcription factor [Haploplasma axanthum]|uniref:Transcriptional repressor smtB homolog n=1 Tax=Haploplasma axanthum TaxID=29552 RepID=A0A449BEK7_HAPAX|nr:metalloregulator ArsR/SmtB family transcription factor [Haploplasma axanthum]VEU80867.1 Transcriptional repressor smtB homolog [Haploplasma axanthum]